MALYSCTVYGISNGTGNREVGIAMSKHSRKGFKKLENHELTEFTTLRGEDCGSDSELEAMELERENISRSGGG